MLRYMGLACITGMGEAESMCAYLNADGVRLYTYHLSKNSKTYSVYFPLVSSRMYKSGFGLFRLRSECGVS